MIVSKMYYVVPTQKYKLYLSFSFDFILCNFTEYFEMRKLELLEHNFINFS